MNSFKKVKSEIFPNPVLDNLKEHYPQLLANEIEALREDKYSKLFRNHWADLITSLKALKPEICEYDLSGNAPKINIKENQKAVNEILKKLIPWRKGPFYFGDTFLDSEWRAYLKWNKIKNEIGSLENQNVLDIGCANGYYMLRMLHDNPRFVLGIDPSERSWFQFMLMQNFIQSKKIQFEMFGVENVHLFPEFFDTVFCMGIIYHQRSPIDMLLQVKKSIRKDGLLVLESMALPGDDEYALCVSDRYSKMHNVYYIPSAKAMVSWLKKARYKDVKIVYVSGTDLSEQRISDYSPYDSLESFLDPNDKTKTVEGYPAPIRVAVTARNS